MREYDVVVVGAGPGGLAAAAEAGKSGAKVLLTEREKSTGGILNQCIHDGFGLVRYREMLSGPEYASRALAEAEDAGVEILCDAIVTDLTADRVLTIVKRDGLEQIKAGAVVLATGCRERTRGNIMVPGSRPAGVFTAGVAQNLINTKNIMVGGRVVILGSGDVGLIMARRLTLEGADVLAVAEVMKEPTGLARNVKQCLFDFGIPLYLSHTVSRIYGKQRVCGVDIAKLDENREPIPGSEKHFDCDTLILSVGLIPENEVAECAGVSLDRKNNGTLTDDFLMTDVPGIFSCGNSRKVMDLADFVSEQGALAGRNAALYVQGKEMLPWKLDLVNAMKKGMPEEGTITCTLCPNGCSVKLEADGTTGGNKCERGAEFARKESVRPMRTLTTSIRVTGGTRPVVPVRSDGPVEFGELRMLAEKLAELSVEAPVAAGDVVAKVGKSAVPVIAEISVPKAE